jgi:hypothetical protein
MTNLKDLLNDLAEDILKITDEIRTSHDSPEEDKRNWESQKEEKIDETLKIFKDRCIGE